MRAFLVLVCALSVASARARILAIEVQAAPSLALAALEQMSLAERENSNISVEFESSDDDAMVLARAIERCWNGGQYDEALAQLGDLEARVGHVAVGNSWRKPLTTSGNGFWGRDVRIGNRDSLRELSLDVHHPSGNLFAVVRRGGMPHFAVYMSSDTGVTWEETFNWSGSPPLSLDAAVLANHLYVAYNSPADAPQQVRLRRFVCSDGRADTFRGDRGWVTPCTLEVGDTMKEVSIVTNPNNNRLYLVTLVSDGSVQVSLDDANAVSWARRSTGITSGASSGLDAAENQRSDTANLFFSYYDVSDTLRIHGFGQPLSLPAGNGTPTSISAYLDTVICAYEDETSSPHRVAYSLSYDSSAMWTTGTLSDTGVAADAPAVALSGGSGVAAVYRSSASATELQFCQRTDSGFWSDPVSIAENAPGNSRPGIVCLGSDVFGVAYLSNTSPVARGAYFDRSDWVYGIAGQRRPEAGEGMLSVTPNPLKGHGRLSYTLSHPADLRVQMYDHAGRVVRALFEGHSPAGSLAVTFGVSGIVPGVYFICLDTPGFRAVKKAVVTR